MFDAHIPPPREKEYRDFVDYMFQAKRDGIDGLLHGAVGLAGESAEVLDNIKKTWVYDRELPREKLLEELGDTLHYLFMVMIKLSEDHGAPDDSFVTLSTLMLNNMRKLRKRYPNGFTKYDAIARVDQQVK